jgi:dienelactone hydrolase
MKTSRAISLLCLLLSSNASAAPGDEMLAAYFRQETAALSRNNLTAFPSLDEWESQRALLRDQLLEMLSLSPLPERTPLQAVVTGKIEHELFTVEKLHFQSLPGLYVTANLYLPKNLDAPAPAILYVCGHARVVKNGISYGNKTAYQHHGAWFARNGYVSLLIDTIQLGEIEGIHHGTHREGLWWWNSRGYTPAGVEAWNSIRALDFLQSRSEIDPDRIGVTGRSGGGAYSWWVAALDERVQVAAPVAGITDLENHVVDGVVEGHCDCMFMVNTYRWDYPVVAALLAPRPLLIANSDKDSIFPLEGVIRTHAQVRHIYNLYSARDKLGLLITEGPHKDTQDLQLPVFRWFNRFFKNDDSQIEMAALRFFEPEELKVFDSLPADERTSKIHETFIAPATFPDFPQNPEQWNTQRQSWIHQLREKVFNGWPTDPPPHQVEEIVSFEKEDLRITAADFISQPSVPLRLFLVQNKSTTAPAEILLHILDDSDWKVFAQSVRSTFGEPLHPHISPASDPDAAQVHIEFQERLSDSNRILAFATPRGIGLTAWNPNQRKQVQIRRRFMLLGQTADGMRVWDIRRTLQTLRELHPETPVSLIARGDMGVNALYAAIFEPELHSIQLTRIPSSHREGPDYLNVLRFLDIPQAAALAAERTPLILLDDPANWTETKTISTRLQWNPAQLQLIPAPARNQ